MPSFDNVELEKRAISAYFRNARKLPGNAQQPARGATTIVVVDGIRYVCLRNSFDLLAVYKVRANGRVQRIKDDAEVMARLSGQA